MFSACTTETRKNSSVIVDSFAKSKEARVIPHEFPFKSNQASADLLASVNDPFYTRNWGIKAVSASQAWLIEKGKKNIVVAVIDTGADIHHEDLKGNFWKNPGETGLDKNGKSKKTNGLDDDGNGYIDDVNGWNFVANNSDLKDNDGHGTHISGIISARVDNKKGVVGIAPNVPVMVLKYYDPKFSGSYDPLESSLKAIEYAINNGANIINYSGGGNGFSARELRVLKKAERKGILVVTAAGNGSSNADDYPFYPASYRLSNIVSVASVDKKGSLLQSSNYGVSTVDIAAPGDEIYSTFPGNKYGYKTGTSQATAFVTGAAALIMSKFVNIKIAKVKEKILKTIKPIKNLQKKIKTAGVLDVASSLIPEVNDMNSKFVSKAMLVLKK